MEEGANQTTGLGDSLLYTLWQGKPVRFDPPTQTPEPHDARARCTIPAALLHQLVDRTHGRLEPPVEIAHAVIAGPLDLTHVGVERPFAITDSEFTGTVDCTFATFTHGLRLDGSHFHQAVSFRGVDITGDFSIRNAVFAEEVILDDLHVSLILDASGTSSLAGGIQVLGLDVAKDVYFTGATFARDANFNNGRIGGLARFDGAHFEQLASFTEIRVEGSVYFAHLDGEPANFKGIADFRRAHLGGLSIFTGVQFDGETNFLRATFSGLAHFIGAQFDGAAHFDRITFGGECLFQSDDEGRHPVRFAQTAGFRDIQVSGRASFSGAQFDGAVDFNSATFSGTCLFRSDDQDQLVQFAQVADFSNAQISGRADFTAAQFSGEAYFVAARLAGDAIFTDAVFTQGADFGSVNAVHVSNFEYASFLKSTSFAWATFGTVSFVGAELPVPPSQPHPVAPAMTRTGNHAEATPEQSGADSPPEGTVDLTGMTYVRMLSDWQALFNRFDPYDRQPYTQLEATLRQAGDDHAADDVYYARRRREFRNLLARHSRWDVLRIPGDALYWVLAGYGVRPLRFVLWSVLALAVGTWVFLQPNAVTYADAAKQEALGRATPLARSPACLRSQS
jgi:uncharacterized protein YjbI with pentapeptide repeats